MTKTCLYFSLDLRPHIDINHTSGEGRSETEGVNQLEDSRRGDLGTDMVGQQERGRGTGGL